MHTQDTRSIATTRSDRCTRYALTVRQVIRIRDHEERQVHMLEPEDTQDTRARDHEERQMYMLEPEDTQDTHVGTDRDHEPIRDHEERQVHTVEPIRDHGCTR